MPAQPESPLYGEALSRRRYLDWFWDSYDAAAEHSSEWRELAEDLYLLYASKSWKEADRRWLEKTHRIPVEANLILSTVEAIVGSDLLARQEVHYQPETHEEPADQLKGDMLTHLGRVFREKCKGHNLDARALFDMLVTGEGWGSGFLDTAGQPMRPTYDIPSPLEMYRDPDATDDNLRDAQFVIRKRRLRLEHAQAMWPDKADLLAELAEADFRSGRTMGAVAAGFVRDALGIPGKGTDQASREVWVYEHQYWRMVPTIHFTDPMTGQDRSLPEKEFGRFAKEVEIAPGSYYSQPRKRFFRSFVAATRSGRGEEEILSNKPVDKLDTFLAHALTGYRKVVSGGRRVTFFGIVEVAADGQRLINRTLSAILDYLAKAVKGGADVEEDALPEGMTLAQYAQQRSVTGGYALVANGAISENRIKHHSPPTWPSGFEKMFELLVGVHDSTTVGGHFRGQLTMKTADSSKAFDAANIQTQIVLARLMANLSDWRESMGKTQVSLAINEMPRIDLEPLVGHFKLEGVTHLTEQDPVTGEPFETPLVEHPVELLLAEDPFAWSVIVDTGSSSPSSKQQSFQMFMNGLLETLRDAGMPPQVLLEPLLEVSPFPRTTVAKMQRGMREHQEAAQEARTMEQFAAQLAQMDEESRFLVLSGLAQQFNVPLLPPDEQAQGPPPEGPPPPN